MRADETHLHLLNLKLVATEIQKVHQWIEGVVEKDPSQAFNGYWNAKVQKHLVYVDLEAENLFKRALAQKAGGENLLIVGEESLTKGLDFSDETKFCVLLDMVDGTDLLQRGFSNWCSAIVVLNPRLKSIETAYVALPDILYYANSQGAYKVPLRAAAAQKGHSGEPKLLKVSPQNKRLRDAGVCTYAQKSNALLELMEHYRHSSQFRLWLDRVAKSDKSKKKLSDGGAGFRFYDLAGNPMIARMGDGSVDVVFDLRGQQPHDFAAGVYIAMKAGAVFGDAKNRKIFDDVDLANMLFKPADSRVSYILAANKKLYEETFNLLNSTNGNVTQTQKRREKRRRSRQ